MEIGLRMSKEEFTKRYRDIFQCSAQEANKAADKAFLLRDLNEADDLTSVKGVLEEFIIRMYSK